MHQIIFAIVLSHTIWTSSVKHTAMAVIKCSNIKVKRLKVNCQHLYTATYMNMTSSGLQCEVAYWPAMTLGGAAQHTNTLKHSMFGSYYRNVPMRYKMTLCSELGTFLIQLIDLLLQLTFPLLTTFHRLWEWLHLGFMLHVSNTVCSQIHLQYET